MPTYILTTSNINLNLTKQEELARRITKIHNVVISANTKHYQDNWKKYSKYIF